MTYTEKTMDLFSVSDDYYLAHCISADFAMGKGIAVEFNTRFSMKKNLQDEYPYYLEYYIDEHVGGECIQIDRVFNLITKERYYNKPTIGTLEDALRGMKKLCKDLKVRKIAMPKIGCGLDRLKWSDVSELIQEVFKDTDIEILVCKI